jgi:hypothetical protein
MALDHTHPGGPTLANKYIDIMHGRLAPPAPGLPFVDGGPEAPRVGASTSWRQVEWVLDNMWWDYETFVYSCKPAFKIRRVMGEPRNLDLRKRFNMRRWVHRGVGEPAAAAVRQLRHSLITVDNELRISCYQPQNPPIGSLDHPPTMPRGSKINPNPLGEAEKQAVANFLQDFRDRMSIAVQQVHAYIGILQADAQKRQAWFDNAIKLVTAVTALGTALAPL